MDYEMQEQLIENFNLLCDVIRQKQTDFQKNNIDLSKIEEIISKKLPDAVKHNAPEDFYEYYSNFKNEYDKFKDFILYDKLVGKNVVSLGGGFSSGKSSFLNTLMNEDILPEEIDPSTSVPTYIVHGENDEVLGINVFDAKIQIKPEYLQLIAHGFGIVKDQKGKLITEEVTLGHILESVFVSTPIQRFKHIAFLDTPGYTKAESSQKTTKTDAEIARRQLNSSNYILWFIQADAGTITEEDVRFLKTIRGDIPKLIIVNKADKKSLSDLKKIIDKVKSTLQLKGIRYVDVHAFSNKIDQITDSKHYKFVKHESREIVKCIKNWDKQIYQSNFARNFKVLFSRCRKYYDEKIDGESRKLTSLNTSLTKLSAEDIGFDTIAPLQEMVTDIQRNISNTKSVRNKLKELQDEFFAEIKLVSNLVGISMPEPSEIDLLQENATDPLELLERYKKKNGIRTDPNIAQMLENTLKNVNPTINKQAGGAEYKDELMAVLKAYCSIKQSDIHIHDVYKNTTLYAELIKNS